MLHGLALCSTKAFLIRDKCFPMAEESEDRAIPRRTSRFFWLFDIFSTSNNHEQGLPAVGQAHSPTISQTKNRRRKGPKAEQQLKTVKEEIQELEQQLNTAKEQIQDLDAEDERLKRKNEGLENEISRVRSQLDQQTRAWDEDHRKLQEQLRNIQEERNQLQAQLGERGKECNRLQAQLGAAHEESDRLQGQLRAAGEKCNGLQKQLRPALEELSELKEKYKRLKDASTKHLEELEERRGYVEVLQQNISEQERVVERAHKMAVSELARNVSSDFPDGEIKAQFRTLQNNVFDWCMDNKLERINADLGIVVAMLTQSGVLLPENGALPKHLQFDARHSTATAVLLEAALSRELCRKTLDDPFFLASRFDTAAAPQAPNFAATMPGAFPTASQVTLDGITEVSSAESWRQSLYKAASALPRPATIDWRIETCKFLEQVCPPSSPAAKRIFHAMAMDFVMKYRFLIQPLSSHSEQELVDLFENFGRLALRLSKRRTAITIEDFSYHSGSLTHFHAMHDYMEAHPAVKLLAGDGRLDGRPICVVVWPRIVSEPINKLSSNGASGSSVVWTSAVVWVSNKEEEGEAAEKEPKSHPTSTS